MSVQERDLIILASGSPRRRDLLSRAGLEFEIIPSSLVEDLTAYSDPEEAVRELARQKAKEVGSRYKSHFIIAADTIVVLEEADGSKRVLGKPADDESAVSMLQDLQGREHLVLTGYTIYCEAKGVDETRIVTTKVRFASMNEEEIRAYVATGEPRDKAGGYGIQGKGSVFITEIHGSYTNVVGLPLAQLLEDLKRHNLWSTSRLQSGA